MIEEIHIKNFKSIAGDTIALGRVNVFIGENGCGKSNILEAVAFASVSKKYDHVDGDILHNNNIRVTKPILMVNQFEENEGNEKNQDNKNTVDITLKIDNKIVYCTSTPSELEYIKSYWGENLKISAQENDILEKMLFKLQNNKDDDAMNKGFANYIVEIVKKNKEKEKNIAKNLINYALYTLNTQALRGLGNFSYSQKGLFGENLDEMIANLTPEETEKLKSYSYFVEWFEDFLVDGEDTLKLEGHKLNFNKSLLYFKDKFMPKDKNLVFVSENANEGILHLLFYLTMMISHKTPSFFAIDNIESCLNPHLCRKLMTEICKLAKENDKQILVTTYNPAILDGLNLLDDEIRLFEVKRNQYGHTKTKRIKIKPNQTNELGEKYKLSELWTRGFLGAISKNF